MSFLQARGPTNKKELKNSDLEQKCLLEDGKDLRQTKQGYSCPWDDVRLEFNPQQFDTWVSAKTSHILAQQRRESLYGKRFLGQGLMKILASAKTSLGRRAHLFFQTEEVPHLKLLCWYATHQVPIVFKMTRTLAEVDFWYI